jgi:two-component system, NarL family, response regulator NreC
MNSEPIRVLIADDHTIVRSGVCLLLNAEPDMQVVGEALDGREALELAGSLQPDVVLMDIAMPVMDGLEATRQLKERWPHIHIIILTMHRSDEYFFEVLKAGASGYILKGAKPGELLDAVRVVAQGQVFLYPTMARKLLSDYLNRVEGGSDPDQHLSLREKEILRLLAAGHSNKEIADALVVSPSTIHSHRSNLMRKLGLNSRHELFQYARKHGLLDHS